MSVKVILHVKQLRRIVNQIWVALGTAAAAESADGKVDGIEFQSVIRCRCGYRFLGSDREIPIAGTEVRDRKGKQVGVQIKPVAQFKRHRVQIDGLPRCDCGGSIFVHAHLVECRGQIGVIRVRIRNDIGAAHIGDIGKVTGELSLQLFLLRIQPCRNLVDVAERDALAG